MRLILGTVVDYFMHIGGSVKETCLTKDPGKLYSSCQKLALRLFTSWFLAFYSERNQLSKTPDSGTLTNCVFLLRLIG